VNRAGPERQCSGSFYSVNSRSIALIFPAPALVLAFSDDTAVLLAVAFALQYAGLLAERWYFLAEANHPQNLYYQAIS